MVRSTNNPWLHRFAIVLAAATLCLICVGGLVTSHGVGMSVPDWPNTFGYNMFFFPFSKWIGGVLYEHSHRLIASAVGFLTIILAVWLWLHEERKWLRWLGVIALVAVIVQGVLGGLRVTWMKDELGIFHATLAQLFFALACSIALFSSKWWNLTIRISGTGRDLMTLRNLALAATMLILLQLCLGATMRHQHAGLAIPDFPTAYGRAWPAADNASVAHYNQLRTESVALNPITRAQIIMQMAHRIGAVAICLVASLAFTFAIRKFHAQALLRRLIFSWAAFIACQFLLGAATIWTNKSADVATAHVAFGALSLANAVLLVLVSSRYLWQPSQIRTHRPASVEHQRPPSRPAEAVA